MMADRKKRGGCTSNGRGDVDSIAILPINKRDEDESESKRKKQKIRDTEDDMAVLKPFKR
jgi:hypothetical protein